ncbi:unnamed protein product, partial [Prorocentrum cordatum]
MATLFGIREFQFYDAFESYSRPPSEGKSRWECAAFGRPVSRSVIEAYTSEIREQGGRAWLYVQAMATAPGDAELQREAGVAVVGQHVVDGRPRVARAKRCFFMRFRGPFSCGSRVAAHAATKAERGRTERQWNLTVLLSSSIATGSIWRPPIWNQLLLLLLLLLLL